MDLHICEEIYLVSKKKYDTRAKLYELLLKFQPRLMTENEKLMYISDISKIILAFVFRFVRNKVS